jgi:phage baseplate assembly protein gpV
MSSIVETIQRIVQNELRAVRIAELGVVEAIGPHSDASDDDNYGCDVRLRNTGLLLKRVPIVTGHLGSAAIPNVGDLVLLTFEKGDVNQGIVLGRLYTDDDRPPVNAANELIMHLPLHADDTSAIQTAIRNLGDTSPPREIIVQMAPKITVRITDGTVRATAGNSELTLDQPDGGGGTVTVLAGGTKITMNQDGEVVVQAVGDVTLDAGGAMTLSAANGLTLRAGTSIEIQAATSLSLQAAAEASVEAAAALSIQAPIISVGGITSFSPG